MFTTEVSDSAVVHFSLDTDGQIVDKFGNGLFPFFLFKSEQEAQPCKGVIKKWIPFLKSPDRARDLREVWSQSNDTNGIIFNTAKLFGINSELMRVGYSTFDESEEIKYDQWLEEEDISLNSFDELHFS